MNCMKNNSWKEVEAVVVYSQDEKMDLNEDEVNWVEEYFRFGLQLFRKQDIFRLLKISECNFSRLLVWPSIEVAVDTIKNFMFIPGEYILKSSPEEYKADGCVLDDVYHEVFILETSGRFMLGEN